MKIAVIGGSGEFGRIFARLFKKEGHEVVITGRDAAKGRKVAEELGVSFTTDNASAARESEVVVISVYIENTLEVIKQVAPQVRPGCLLMDVTSVKTEPCTAMKQFAGEGVEIIGTHPMFGPRVASIEGMSFIVTPIRVKKWDSFLFDFLNKHKAKVFVTTPEEHDRVMAVVQGLTHFAYISIASTLRELNVDVRRTRNFASPVYELMLDFVARIVGQSPQLYASIQMHNPNVREVHENFIAQARSLKEVVERKDSQEFIRIMSSAAKHLGDIDASMGRSDKAILALRRELKELSESIGKEVALKHIYSGVVHVGRVKSVSADEVVITSAGREVSLKPSNVELLGESFLREWKLRSMPRVKQDFSVLLEQGANEEVIKKVVESFDSRIVRCDMLDVYAGRQIPRGKKSVTLRVEAIEFGKEDFEGVKKLLEGIGGTIR